MHEGATGRRIIQVILAGSRGGFSAALSPGLPEGNNTTKTGSIPGGLGLKLLRDFISLNKGRIQIVSDAGYWELANGRVRTRRFDEPFPGTVVNLEMNTADRNSYCLPSEQDSANIF